MKTREIIAGKSYTNGKQVREVLELGEFKIYDSQSDTDCVRYRVTTKGRDGKLSVNDVSQMTRNSFARWAKSEVTA